MLATKMHTNGEQFQIVRKEKIKGPLGTISCRIKKSGRRTSKVFPQTIFLSERDEYVGVQKTS